MERKQLDGDGLLRVSQHNEWKRIREAERFLGRHRFELYRHKRGERDDLLLRYDGRRFDRHGERVFQRSLGHYPLSSKAEHPHSLAEAFAGKR